MCSQQLIRIRKPCARLCSGHRNDVGVVCRTEPPGARLGVGVGWREGGGRELYWITGWLSALIKRVPAPPRAAVTARLVNATGTLGRVSGRLELRRQGGWAPACASGLSSAAATVICKQVRPAGG